MSLKFLEGFGAYATGAHTDVAGNDMRLLWDNYGTLTMNALVQNSNGTRRYLTGAAASGSHIELNGATFTTIVLGMLFWHEDQANSNLIASFATAGGTHIGAFGLKGHKLIYSRATFKDLSANVVLLSTINVKPNTWNYIEVKILFSDTVGTVDFQVNGVAAGSVSGVDTKANAGTVGGVEFVENTSDDDWQSNNRMADLYLADADFHGPTEIWYQEADGSGTESGFTPNASTNESQVDEIGSDEDSTFNQSTTLQTDSLTTTRALDDDPIAIQPMGHARKVSGASTLRFGTKSDPGGTPTESFGSALGLADSYLGVVGAIDEVDPDTASPWTAANADAAEIMYEQVT